MVPAGTRRTCPQLSPAALQGSMDGSSEAWDSPTFEPICRLPRWIPLPLPQTWNLEWTSSSSSLELDETPTTSNATKHPGINGWESTV